jgi:hypothetical protein
MYWFGGVMVSMLALSPEDNIINILLSQSCKYIYIIPSRYSPSQNTEKPNNLKVSSSKKTKEPKASLNKTFLFLWPYNETFKLFGFSVFWLGEYLEGMIYIYLQRQLLSMYLHQKIPDAEKHNKILFSNFKNFRCHFFFFKQ